MLSDPESQPRPDTGDVEQLLSYETFWRDHQKWLESCGYLLRPRFMPDWVPSWKGTKQSWVDCEDGEALRFGHLIDATRTSDGALVAMKRVYKSIHPYEVEIGSFLLSESLSSDPRNHTVPTHEVLELPGNEDVVLIVMPFLRQYDSPRFDTYGEVMGCLKQILEGLQFMHQHLVAHRDCNARNIMMDPSSLYPKGFHPVEMDMKRDFSGTARNYTRTQCPPKYFLIDFGISCRYKPEDMPPDEDIIRGGDKSVPEFQGDAETANPFPTDIYFIGNMIREDFLQEKYGFDFLAPLVADMVQDDPDKRPTMDEVLNRFDTISKGLSSWKLRSRVVYRNDWAIMGFFRSISHWTRRIGFILRRVPAIPIPRHDT